MKDILKTMIDNNEPHWSADTMDMVRVELEHVYAQAAKADEYEAKAMAWDKLSMSIRECNKEIELKGGLNAMFRTSKKGQIVQRHIDCFESGDHS